MFELNYAEVKNIKNEIKNLTLFHAPQEDTSMFEVIHDFEHALFCAFEYYDYKMPCENGREHSGTWVDILEGEASEIWGIVYQQENWKDLSREIHKLEAIEDILFLTHNWSKETDELDEEIIAELELCVRARAVMGRENSFFENVYKAYQMGGFPCGVSNKDTKKLIVYFPNK